jgi:two-component system KDP operon response regulator KdpE
VLIVDDDPSVATVLEIMLTASGHEVAEVVGDGHSAVRALQATRPDCVILDVTLPDTDGQAVLRILRDVQKGVRVVMFSGHDDAELARELIAAGADAVVVKGGDPQELLDAIG